jgi:tetratricopeptide (TPR) repeat protein
MKVKTHFPLAVLSCIFVGSVVFGQAPLSPQMKTANELLNSQKFAEAADTYEAIVKSDPADGAAWYQLGSARYSLKQYDKAAAAFEKNVTISDSGFAMFNLACVYSLMGQKDKAVEWLTKTVDNPKTILPGVNFADPDLTSIKDDARVKSLWEKVDHKIHPCKYSAENVQFNFWVGEWDVFNPQGRKVGTSLIQNIASGCGVLENWTDGFGGTGKSINFYDANDKKWHQYWIGQNGSPSRYSGNYSDGALRYIGEPYELNGKHITPRLTFFNVDANTVRQFAEKSDDDGKTWTTVYDFKYVRRPQAN